MGFIPKFFIKKKLGNELLWLTNHKILWNFGHSPQNRSLLSPLRIIFVPLGLPGWFWEFNFRQRLWDKVWCYWEYLGEQIGNLRNVLELFGKYGRNRLRMWWEQFGISKSKKLPTSQSNKVGLSYSIASLVK